MLSGDDIKRQLPAGWTIKEGGMNAIQRHFEFKDFKEAWRFMNDVAREAENHNHHPDWSNSWNKVTINLTTHDAGGVTQADLDLASVINSLLE